MDTVFPFSGLKRPASWRLRPLGSARPGNRPSSAFPSMQAPPSPKMREDAGSPPPSRPPCPDAFRPVCLSARPWVTCPPSLPPPTHSWLPRSSSCRHRKQVAAVSFPVLVPDLENGAGTQSRIFLRTEILNSAPPHSATPPPRGEDRGCRGCRAQWAGTGPRSQVRAAACRAEGRTQACTRLGAGPGLPSSPAGARAPGGRRCPARRRGRQGPREQEARGCVQGLRAGLPVGPGPGLQASGVGGAMQGVRSGSVHSWFPVTHFIIPATEKPERRGRRGERWGAGESEGGTLARVTPVGADLRTYGPSRIPRAHTFLGCRFVPGWGRARGN